MKAVIMAGGRGTRLMPLTRRVPKPMVPLIDRPMLEYVLDTLKRNGFYEVGLTVGYKADVIQEHFGDGRRQDMHLLYGEEIIPLGTAGGVRNIGWFLDEAFVVMSGDGLTDIDLQQAIRTHKALGGLATIVLTTVSCPLGLGVVDLFDNGRVRAFIEKPTSWVEGRKYLVNTGIYVLEPEILSFIPAATPYDFGRELFPQLLRLGIPMFGYVAPGYWSDVGTLQQYYQAQLDILDGRVHVPLSADMKAAIPTLS